MPFHIRDGGHNGQRDEAGEERVLDEILALLVANETCNKMFHFGSLVLCRNCGDILSCSTNCRIKSAEM